MATSKERFPIFERERFYKAFPHLTKHNHKPTSNATPEIFRPKKPYYVYNCFAFVVDDRRRFWWPDDEDSYWPRKNAPNTVEEIMSVLRDHGYEECEDEAHENGVQKVAIFVTDGVPVHVAIQPSSRDGIWKSKMANNIDMEHELHVIETLDGDDPEFEGFGKAVRFMRLAKKQA